ncbi:MAG TPA: 16S rRNA (adenine(1518)-N(6)/adenine(1519)-N(6))-dimethyltransferase RsmA [Candidatus Binatia bacterium]|nr:16S rRNA (adenine(1518)-N(6)/adenine(1519)-N(6))-dimethyltransferase RsmA [Candidatus Binatia bacterium]
MPTLLQQARFALGELGIRPHKQLGQHFLIDPAVIARMIAAARIGPADTVLEIGPGLGALSESLTEASARLYLVELDTLLADRLRQRFAGDERVHVITADFLSLDLPATFPEPEIHVVASLPYNVATPILFRLLEHRRQFPEATVMIQKEVAERLSAAPGTKAYGVPSVLTQLHATVTTVGTVRPGSFFPAPKVESQIVRLVFQQAPRVAMQDERVFQRVVKAAFAQRRKTLRNALRAVGYNDLDAVSAQTGIDLQRRGETLNLEEFAALANRLAEPTAS